jgi:hypothetical protein
MSSQYKHTDLFGNYLEFETSEFGTQVYLYLKEENRKRNIAKYEEATKTLLFSRDREKHLFRKINGYGFCYALIHLTDFCENIVVYDDFETFKITKSTLNKYGQIYNFKNHGGFETQIFISLENLKQ